MIRLVVLGVVFAGVTGGAWWLNRKLEERQRERAEHMTRLYEVTFLRQLLAAAGSEKNRSHILNSVLTRRPGIREWSEWKEVWGDTDPAVE